jgi:EmrB/QacA subfamily drug resistance transporter
MQADNSLNRQYPGYATRWRGLVFLGISLIVISLDNTILNVALPSISRSLSATASDLQWIVDAYVLVFAALLLTTGSIGDRWGRKKALQLGLVWFGLGSLAAALSTSTLMLIASRAFLGVGGALIMPATLSIISGTFPPNERPQAIAIWASVFALGVGIGPVIGGWLVERFAWSSVFFVNLPVIAIALIGGARYLADSKDEHAPSPDIPGVILSIIGLFALVYGIIEAGVLGWTHEDVIIAFVVAFIFLGAFALWESRAKNAMLPMEFFRNMSFTGANTALALVSFSLFGSVFFLSQYFQTVQNAPGFEAGLRVLPMAITLTIVASQSARVCLIYGIKRTVAFGIGLAAVALLFMALVYKVDTPYWVIAIGQVLLALGLGTATSPATSSVMGSVPVRKAGIGSAMNDTTRQLGGAFGIALLGTVMNNAYTHGVQSLQTLGLPAQTMAAIGKSIQAAHVIAADPQTPAAVRDTIITTTNQAFVDGMTAAMLVGATVMGLACVVVLLILPDQVRRSPDTLPTTETEMEGERPRTPAEISAD